MSSQVKTGAVPMVMGPSLSQGSVSMSSPWASLCVILLRATSTHAAEFTQKAGTPASSGISCSRQPGMFRPLPQMMLIKWA